MKKNYFYNLILTLSNLLIHSITFPYVARVLGPAGVGKIQFIVTLCQYLALLAALGIPIYGIREIAKVKGTPRELAQTVKELLYINVCTALILFLLYEFAVFTIPYFAGDRPMFAIAGVIILFGFSSIEWLFSGLEQFKQIALRSVVIKSISLVLMLLLVKDRNNLYPYLWICMFGLLGNNLLNIWSALKIIRVRTGRVRFKRHIRPLLYLLGTTIASTLYTNFDGIILGFISGDKAVGLYTAATKLTKIAIPAVIAYGGVLLPSITRSIQEQDNNQLKSVLDQSFAYIVMVAAPLCSGIFVFAPQLIRLFCGEEFDDAIWSMRVMSFLPLLIGLGYFWGYQVILPLGKDRFLFNSALVGLAISLVLNFTLVPGMAHRGAAIANVAAEVIVTITYFVLIRKHIPVVLRHHYLRDALLSSAIFFVFLFPERDYLFSNDVLTMLVSGGAALIGYFLLQMFVFRNDILLSLLAKHTNIRLFQKHA